MPDQPIDELEARVTAKQLEAPKRYSYLEHQEALEARADARAKAHSEHQAQLVAIEQDRADARHKSDLETRERLHANWKAACDAQTAALSRIADALEKLAGERGC